MMFKEIPGSTGVMINLNLETQMKDGSACTLPVSDGYVTMELYGSIERVSIEWLAILAHYEITEKSDFDQAYIGKILVTKTKNRCGFWILFRNPVVVGGKYRVVPSFPKYAVSEDGEVVDRYTLEKLSTIIGTWNRNGVDLPNYSRVEVLDPDKSRKRQVAVHRMVATAWVRNPDPGTLTIVDHLDGLRHYHHRSNLEWVDDRENLKRAVRRGDIKAQVTQVHDVPNGIITTHESIMAAFDYIGCPRAPLTDRSKFRPPLYKGRYEVKLFDDQTPFFYTKDTLPSKNARYTITVTHPDGEVEVIEGIEELKPRFKLWNLHYPTPQMVEVAQERNPELKFVCLDRKDHTPVQALHVETMEVIEYPTFTELARHCKIHRNECRRRVLSAYKWVWGGYIYRYKSEDPWPEKFELPPKPKCILGVELDTGREAIASSMRNATELTGVCRKSVKAALDEDRPISGWRFSYVDYDCVGHNREIMFRPL